MPSAPLATSAATAVAPKLTLIGAVQSGNLDEVKALLAKGADPNVKDKYQAKYDGDEDGLDRTPLHYAVMYRVRDTTPEIVELLITKGANVNAADADGATPLHYALGTNTETTEDREIVEKIAAIFIAHGANINAPHPMTGDTPLHMAVKNGYRKSIQLLIAKGANVNARNKAGQTPLFYAIGENIQDIAELLLEHGADVNIKNTSGKTPLSIAQENNNSDLIKLLRAHGAKE